VIGVPRQKRDHGILAVDSGSSPARSLAIGSATFVAGSYAVVVLDEKTEGALQGTM
jgi:hypothetical protein